MRLMYQVLWSKDSQPSIGSRVMTRYLLAHTHIHQQLLYFLLLHFLFLRHTNFRLFWFISLIVTSILSNNCIHQANPVKYEDGRDLKEFIAYIKANSHNTHDEL